MVNHLLDKKVRKLQSQSRLLILTRLRFLMVAAFDLRKGSFQNLVSCAEKKFVVEICHLLHAGNPKVGPTPPNGRHPRLLEVCCVFSWLHALAKPSSSLTSA